jgi:hypothetical protein
MRTVTKIKRQLKDAKCYANHYSDGMKYFGNAEMGGYLRTLHLQLQDTEFSLLKS